MYDQKSILVVHHGQPWESLCATSLIKRLHKDNYNLSLDWSTTEDSNCLLKYNKRINNLFTGESIPSLCCYDTVIFLSDPDNIDMQNVEYKNSFGWGQKCCPKDVEAYFSGERINKHVLQILYRASGLSWRGEGYDFSYYPRNKTKHSKTGIAIADSGMRSYVKDNLQLRFSNQWHVPMKKSLLKRVDEINRCQRIVTDDLFTVHAALALRKHVEFLDTENFRSDIEFFGHGNRIVLNHEK